MADTLIGFGQFNAYVLERQKKKTKIWEDVGIQLGNLKCPDLWSM